jgi:hypothetical protein
MPRRALSARRPGLALSAAPLLVALVLFGALVRLAPYLTRASQPVAQAPAPSALFALSEFALAPGEQACMNAVTIDPHSEVAQFRLRPPKPTLSGGPPVELVLRGAGYRSVAHVAGGYPGGAVGLAFTPPRRTLIGEACFVDRGRTPVLLDGTSEPRTISRSALLIGGKRVVGDVALTFLESRSRTQLQRLGEIFAHASNLTDRLVPVWLIWVLAVLVAGGVPVAVVVAFYRALLEDEAAAAG